MPAVMKPGPQIQAELTVPQADNHEAQMARADLYRAAKHAMKLFEMIQEGQELEGWVQAKITKSADYLDSVFHYMEYQMKFGNGATVSSLEDITGDAEVSASDEVIPEEEDDEVEVKEGMTYEQKLNALLEAKVKRACKMKEADKKSKTSKKKTEKKVKEEKIEELSPETLKSYKDKATAQSLAADKAGDYKKGHKRFKGVVKATIKQFDQAAKKSKD